MGKKRNPAVVLTIMFLELIVGYLLIRGMDISWSQGLGLVLVIEGAETLVGILAVIIAASLFD